jgi:membrane protein YdbS with pleckstrin-like domain
MLNLEGQVLPERVKKIWLLRTLIVLVVLVGILFGVNHFVYDFHQIPWLGWGLAGVFVLVILFSLLDVTYQYATYRYSITDKFVNIQEGWLFKKNVTIPMNRVQNVTISQGPLMAGFKLTKISIETSATAFHIFGLESDTAAELRDGIIEVARKAREENDARLS